MATPYTVALKGGGSMTVNASSQAAAEANVVAQGGTPESLHPNDTTSSAPAPAKSTSPTSPAATTPAQTYNMGGAGGPTISGSGSAPANLVQAVTDYYNAITTGNVAAANEAIREFNLNYTASLSTLTGTINGQPTLAGTKQASDIAQSEAALTGTFNGHPTLAAEKQASDLANQQWSQGQTAQQQVFTQGVTAAGLTGTYAAPSSYPPGTWLTDPKTGQYGQVGANGQVTTYPSQAAAQAAGLAPAQLPAPAAPQGAVPQGAAPGMPSLADFNNLPPATQATYAQYNGGVAGGAAKWLQDATAAVQQAGGQAAPASGAGAPTLADFNNLPPATQATYAQYNGGTAGGATKWLADATAAFQAAGGTVAPASPVGNAAAGGLAPNVTSADASTWGGNGAPQQTQAAQQQQFQQAFDTTGQMGFDANGQATLGEQQLGLDALKQQSTLQSDPFRQQQYEFGLGAGGYSRAIDAMNGTTGFATSQGGQGSSAAGTNTLAYLGQQIQQYDPAHMAAFYANTLGAPGAMTMGGSSDFDEKTGTYRSTGTATPPSQSPMGSGMATYNASLNALPNSANKIVGANYLKADKATQQFITSGLSAKTGLDQDTIDSQIKNTMPKFNAPSFGFANV